jgi:(p)ppGpp synthase/HD superfamily hydrolase
METTEKVLEVAKFIEWAFKQHDEVCNQKYARHLPYSMHLKWVQGEVDVWAFLLTNEERIFAYMGAVGHDLIEDARVTYNDIAQRIGVPVADIIYACTEEKGRDRAERHSERYYLALAQNEVAIFVKLCDTISNVKYSILDNSTMLKKYREEFHKLNGYLYTNRFAVMFRYLESLLFKTGK